jgi:CBS domain containing-hemolysin-like protein
MGLADLLIVLLLLFANAVFVAAEFALVKVRITQIEQLAESGHWSARIVLKILNDLDRYISASQLGITLASLGLGWTIESSIEPAIDSALVALGMPEATDGKHSLPLVPMMSFLFVTFLHISLGELVPKSLAIRIAKPVALWTGPPLLIFYYVFYPAIWVLNTASELLLKAVGLGNLSDKELLHTADELRLIVAQAGEGGNLSRNERVMIENVLDLEEKTARKFMVPRPDIIYMSLSRPVEDNLRIARQAGHTRFPLCETDLNTVIGIVHIKDLFQTVIGQGNLRPDLRKLARDVSFVPESLHLDQLLVEFQRNRVHLSMIVDEFGNTIGMISLENVLEELVGPIQDEFDKESPAIEQSAENSYEIDATCPLDRLTEMVKIDPPETDADTVGGYVLERLGRLGRPGDKVPLEDWTLIVVQADPNRIRRLRLFKPEDATAPDETGSVSENDADSAGLAKEARGES